MDAVLTFTARRVTLSKNSLLSIVKDFYEFSRRYQLETANNSNKQSSGIQVFFVDSKEVQQVKGTVMKARSESIFYRIVIVSI